MNGEGADGRVTLVTGASRGIGRAAVLCLMANGHRVLAMARSEEALRDLDDEARRLHGRGVTLVPGDLKDFAAIDGLASVLLERFGRLDGLLANAAVLGPLGPLPQSYPTEFETVLAVNLTANWRLIRALDPLLRAAASGRAVFLTSSVTKAPPAYWGPYTISKAGLEAMVQCYAKETSELPLRVNLFDPGATNTAMRREAMPGEVPETNPDPGDVAAEIAPLLGDACRLHGNRIRFGEDRAVKA